MYVIILRDTIFSSVPLSVIVTLQYYTGQLIISDIFLREHSFKNNDVCDAEKSYKSKITLIYILQALPMDSDIALYTIIYMYNNNLLISNKIHTYDF